jgi:hypothetical protein
MGRVRPKVYFLSHVSHTLLQWEPTFAELESTAWFLPCFGLTGQTLVVSGNSVHDPYIVKHRGFSSLHVGEAETAIGCPRVFANLGMTAAAESA